MYFCNNTLTVTFNRRPFTFSFSYGECIRWASVSLLYGCKSFQPHQRHNPIPISIDATVLYDKEYCFSPCACFSLTLAPCPARSNSSGLTRNHMTRFVQICAFLEYCQHYFSECSILSSVSRECTIQAPTSSVFASISFPPH